MINKEWFFEGLGLNGKDLIDIIDCNVYKN